MAPRTRRAARNQTPATSTTTNTTNSPLFSTNASVNEDSPATTDVEQLPVTKRTNTRSQSQRGKKRPAPVQSENEDKEVDSRPAPKRRATGKSLYVEVAVLAKRPTDKGKDKDIVS